MTQIALMLLALAPTAGVTQTTPAQTPQEDPTVVLPEIEVTAARRGVALGGQEPIVSYDAAQIQAFGATNIGELITLLEAQTRSARGGSPVFLVNGRRISGFREIRGIPPEAIERFDVLPEETALSYGYSANQRVVNIVLKADFKSLTASVNVSRPEQGGRTTTASENNVLRIAGATAGRWTSTARPPTPCSRPSAISTVAPRPVERPVKRRTPIGPCCPRPTRFRSPVPTSTT